MVKPKDLLKDLPYLDNGSNDKTKYRLKLDCNENIYGVSNLVLSVVKNIEEKDISLFPDSEKCINRLCASFNIKKENMFLACDNFDALNKILHAYIEKGDEFLSFDNINEYIVNNLRNLEARIKILDYNDEFTFDKDDFIKNITDKTKAVYLSTPDSVVGYLIKASMMEIIIKEFPDVLFIVDCSYINYANGSVIEDFIDLIKKYDNLAIIKSYSFDYAFAGLKFAYILSNNAIVNEIKKIAVSDVSSIALISAIAQENEKDRIEEIKNLNNKNKELFFEGLKQLGFKPYKSEANFLYCNFFDYCDYYYQKLLNNGIIVKKFKNNNDNKASCLRITVPKEGGVKYILEVLKKKKVLVFNPDEIIFDVSKSYYPVISKAVKILTEEEISFEKILQVKNFGGLKSDYDLIKKIVFNLGYEIDNEEIKRVFNKLIFSNDNLSQKKYIDNTILIPSYETLEMLSKEYDFVLITNHTKEEVTHILENLNISKFFCYIAVNKESFSEDMLIDNSSNLQDILRFCPYNSIKLFGSSVDDIILGNSLNVETIGVVAGEDNNTMKNNFKHLGAKYILNDIQQVIPFLKNMEQ